MGWQNCEIRGLCPGHSWKSPLRHSERLSPEINREGRYIATINREQRGFRPETRNNALIIVTHTEISLHLDWRHLMKRRDINVEGSCWEVQIGEWYHGRFLYCKCFFFFFLPRKNCGQGFASWKCFFLCSQNNFTLSLSVPHSTGLCLLPWILWGLFVRGRNCHNTDIFFSACLALFYCLFLCVFLFVVSIFPGILCGC